MGDSPFDYFITCIKITRLRADKSLYAGIIYASRVYNTATETNRKETILYVIPENHP